MKEERGGEPPLSSPHTKEQDSRLDKVDVACGLWP